MRKIATMFLLIVSVGLLLGGAVSAVDPTVDVAVVDPQTGDNVTVTNPGDEVAADVLVQANDEPVSVPSVEVTVDPKTGLQFEPEKAMMMLNNDPNQIITNNMQNYPDEAFFFFNPTTQTWIWDVSFGINIITNGGQSDLQPGDVVELFAPAIVTDTGPIKVTANLFGQNDDEITVPVANDSYTFLSVPAPAPVPEPEPVSAETVPMQETGTPLALAALGLLSIIGGGLYSRLR